MTRRHGRAVLIAALLIAIAVNVIQFRASDRDPDDNFDALHRNSTADITELVYDECVSCRDRYALHLALRVIAPGSTVLVPASSPYVHSRYTWGVLRQRLYALGLVANVKRVSYRQTRDALAGVNLDPCIVASGPGGARGAPWAVAVAPPLPPGQGTDPDQFLAAALRAGEHRDPHARPREFVLLEGPSPVGSASSYEDLLLETALLPGPIRDELAR